jgi:hypothetical protein
MSVKDELRRFYNVMKETEIPVVKERIVEKHYWGNKFLFEDGVGEFITPKSLEIQAKEDGEEGMMAVLNILYDYIGTYSPEAAEEADAVANRVFNFCQRKDR